MHLIQQAAKAGADAVKLQCWTKGEMVCDKSYQIRNGIWHGRRLAKLYDEAWTPWDWYDELFHTAAFLNLTIFCSVFDKKALAFLEGNYPCPMYKISSFELTDLDLIHDVAATGKPIILSTGMASIAEITLAVEAAEDAGNEDIILLHCISKYPTQFYEAGVNTITRLQDRFGFPVGLSDHCLDKEPTLAATALGAVMIEKHFTLDRDDGGPDALFSVEPNELFELITASRRMASTLTDPNGYPDSNSTDLRRSLYFINHISEGQVITKEDLGCYRPAQGLSPKFLFQIVGSKATKDFKPFTPIRTGDFEILKPVFHIEGKRHE